VRRLRDASGVYAIRDRESLEVLYVGSSVGKLRKTLTRHLQLWQRGKSWWAGAGFGRGTDPGQTYEREGVEVRWRILDGDDVGEAERRWIRRYKPRDNLNLRQRDAVEDGDLPPLPF
jgi:hypothetical protein